MPKKALGFLAALLLISTAGYVFRSDLSRTGISRATNVSAAANEGKKDDHRQMESAVNQAIESKPAGLRASLREYRNLSKDIDQILSEGLEQRNVGGVLAVSIANWQFNSHHTELRPPDELGFERITDSDALVTRVLNNEVRLDDVEMIPLGSGNFRVRIKATNLTTFPLACAIRKGQIFELKDPLPDNQTSPQRKTANYSQNATKAGDDSKGGVYVIPPRDEGTMEFISYCINEDLPAKRGSANITIYQLKDRSFRSVASLRANMRKLYMAKEATSDRRASRS